MQQLPPALAGMAAYRQFLLYKLVPSRTRPGKTDKFPMSLSGDVVDAHDPTHWVDAETALAALQLWGDGFGLAFVFTEQDPFWFIDIDDCLLPDNTWAPNATDLMGWFAGAAVEVSQSGRGLHIFGTGRLPPDVPRRKKSAELGADLYTESRFVALTGINILGDISTDHSATLQWLAATYLNIQPGQFDVPDDGPRSDWSGPVDDDELLERIRSSRGSVASAFGGGRASVQQLLDADFDALSQFYPPDQGGDGYDASAVDLALAQHLAFWTGCDTARIERIMRRTPLAREKWDMRDDYLPRTILRACERQQDVYRDTREQAEPVRPPETPEQIAAAVAAPAPAAPPAGPQVDHAVATATLRDGDGFRGVTQQLEQFAGCAYVMDRHQILTPRGLLDQKRFNALHAGCVFTLSADNRTVSRHAWDAFLGSQVIEFPKVDSACFRPELPFGAIVNDGGFSRVNTYRPIQTRREQGDPSPFLSLLERQLPDERDRRIILSWAASLVQNKGRKFQWWPVIQGAEGNGKSFIASVLRHCIGEIYSFAPNVSDIAKAGNKFNSWIDGRLFLAMEEVYVPERRSFLEDFKTTVTNEWLPIERKGVDQVMGDNRANGIMMTNHQDGVPITVDGRRYAVFFCAQQESADLERDGLTESFFSDLWDWARGRGQWADQGPEYGFAVVHEFLATYAPDPEFDPAGAAQRAPRTSSRDAAVRASRGGVEQTVLEAIEQGEQGFRGGWVSSIALNSLLDSARIGQRLTHRKRWEMLRSLGYVPHPALPDGRVNNPVLPDNAKPRLFVAEGSEAAAIATAAAAAAAYTQAQMELTVPS